jgi:hypothetical protein
MISVDLVSHWIMTIVNKGRSQKEQGPIISGGLREELSESELRGHV